MTSNNKKKNWTRNFRADKGTWEDTCPHGIGHENDVHGCDGCCKGMYTSQQKEGEECQCFCHRGSPGEPTNPQTDSCKYCKKTHIFHPSGDILSTVIMPHPSGVKVGDKMCHKCNRIYTSSPKEDKCACGNKIPHLIHSEFRCFSEYGEIQVIETPRIEKLVGGGPISTVPEEWEKEFDNFPVQKFGGANFVMQEMAKSFIKRLLSSRFQEGSAYKGKHGREMYQQGVREGTEQERESRNKALDLIVRYGGIDGDHHKAWVIDQITRILADNYDEFVKQAKNGEDGENTYSWNEGIAP